MDLGDSLTFRAVSAPVVATCGTGAVTDDGDGTFSFDADSAFDDLALGETRDVTFTFEAVDDSGAASSVSDVAEVTITVVGTNDRPVAFDVAAQVGEDAGGVTAAFSAMDVDATDVPSFRILDVPTDAAGRAYGSVTNNGDGTFTFSPGDQFQFLDAGESRQVSFSYAAIDDSGANNDTSEVRTATITATGADDAPVATATQATFTTTDQSMWDTGPAITFDFASAFPALSFLGVNGPRVST